MIIISFLLVCALIIYDMSYYCNRCDKDIDGKKRTYVTIYNSKFVDDEETFTDEDVDFEVEFNRNKNKMIDICEECEDYLDWSKIE